MNALNYLSLVNLGILSSLLIIFKPTMSSRACIITIVVSVVIIVFIGVIVHHFNIRVEGSTKIFMLQDIIIFDTLLSYNSFLLLPFFHIAWLHL